MKDFFWPEETVTLRELVPGVTVRRHTELVDTLDDGLVSVVDVAVPCCDRVARLTRRVGERPNVAVACPFCRVVYDAEVTDENDGGFACELTVVDQEYVLVRRRPTRVSR